MGNENQRDVVRSNLLSGRSASERGTWRILGEDANCDFGGPHSNPHLTTVEGAYGDAVEYALDLPGFFTWGGGGSIEKIEVVQINGSTIKQRAILTSRRKTLEKELAEVDAELRKLGVK